MQNDEFQLLYPNILIWLLQQASQIILILVSILWTTSSRHTGLWDYVPTPQHTQNGTCG